MQCPEVMIIRCEDALIKIIKDLFIGVRWENMCEGVGRQKLALRSCLSCVKGCSLITSAGCDCVTLLGRLKRYLPLLSCFCCFFYNRDNFLR